MERLFENEKMKREELISEREKIPLSSRRKILTLKERKKRRKILVVDTPYLFFKREIIF